jgi:hypothetical protein
MAKTSTEKAPQKPQPSTQNGGVPSGYQAAEDFVQPAGYWLPEAGPLHGVLVGGYEYKQKNGRARGELRTIYIFKLIDRCTANVKAEGGGLAPDQLDPGELCAVFHSAGLRALSDLAGCAVFVRRNVAKKELPNGNSMWTYDLRFKGVRKPLKVRPAFNAPGNDEPDASTEFNPDEF